jgi:hypothetical protein
MRSTSPVHVPLVHQPHIGVMNQGCRFGRPVTGFPPQMAPDYSMQLAVHTASARSSRRSPHGPSGSKVQSLIFLGRHLYPRQQLAQGNAEHSPQADGKSIAGYYRIGCVAKIEREQGSARTDGDRGVSSGSQAEHLIDEPVLHSGVTLPQPPNLALPNFVHRFVTLNRSPRTTEFPKMLLGTNPLLDGTVILLQDVVQMLNRPMTAALS